VIPVAGNTLFVEVDHVAEGREKRWKAIKVAILVLLPMAAVAAGYWFLVRPFFH
jgi:hypothetical protein